MVRPSRPSADQTRARILQAAKKHFLQQGFDATYIKHIAQAAKVNTNLIFHHFTNKETLWHKVKEAILSESGQAPDYDLGSAKAYFRSLLDYRFSLYSDHPDLVRLIQWQQLTENESVLIGNDASSPRHWLDPIRSFQAQGEIEATVTAEQIMLFIIFSTHAPFMQQVLPLTAEQTADYKQMIFVICCQQFLNKAKE
jgi:AcrR family transcriptional regulator